MFGHLNAEDFTNLIEHAELPAKRRAHLQSCTRCMATLAAVQDVQAQMAPSENDIPEPDWAEFRSSVRDAMLSRSAQRSAAIRRWTGWPVRPAMAWGLSAVFVAGVTAGMLVWNQRGVEPAASVSEIETVDNRETDAVVWSQTDVFDQLAQLKDDEVEHLRRLLEADSAKAAPESAKPPNQ